jgi:hypothetical protein
VKKEGSLVGMTKYIIKAKDSLESKVWEASQQEATDNVWKILTTG